MKKMKHLLAALLLIGSTGILGGGACDAADKLCGPCGEVYLGATTITGNAELDGLFAAVGTLNMTAGSITGNFDAEVIAMAEGVFGIDTTGMATADIVAEIQAQFTAQIESQLEGGISVQYRPPECSANVNVAVSAQAQCEASVDAECSAEVECSGPELSFECSGVCEGSCSAECTVPTCQVEITPGELNCSGECSGSCAVNVSGTCEGKCEGECDAECSAYVDDGAGGFECAGSCSGNCTGTCEVQAEASCEGECRGECTLTGPEAEASCSGDEIGCAGECSGECSGSCQGEVSAPHCEGQAECDADVSAECEAQASAQASANIECTPPSLEIAYNFSGSATAEAQLEVKAKLEAFKVAMIGIIQGWANMSALFDAEYAAEIGIEPPMVAIEASLQAFMSAVASGDFELTAVGLLPCAAPAFQDSIEIIGNLPGEVAGTIQAQFELIGILNIM